MNLKLTAIAGLALLLALFAFTLKQSAPVSGRAKVKPVIRCGPDWSYISEWIAENEIPPIPGAGSYSWKISTRSDSAQFYFNQGINMYYSFHIIEAMASFKKAQRFDPSCAMLYWAEALSYGPNINDIGYAASPDALAASTKAVELAEKANGREKLLIAAQRARYSEDSTQSRAALNQVYADQMKAAYNQYQSDPDVAALYADALMLQHPWDLWSPNGSPKPWTPAIRQVLEKLLVQTPNHPGANHYYIHVMEPSPFAAKAKPSADRLGKLTPGLSHTVHMPSHIYLRTGDYDKGVAVNEDAIHSYKRTLELYAPVSGADFLYSIHNLYMQTNNAMLAGRQAYSVASAEATRGSIPKDYLMAPGALGNYIQYISMTPLLTDIRFGRWSAILSSAAPANELVYANVIFALGKGLAYTAQSNLPEAKNQLVIIQSLMKDSVLALPFPPFSPALDGATIAYNLLAGSIDLAEKRFEKAAAAFSEAVAIEDNMVYNEPRDWMLSPRHYLGYAYLKSGDFKQAAAVFEADLKYNNDNIWSLQGLYDARVGLKQQAEIPSLKKKLDRLKKASDLTTLQAVYF